MVNVYGYLIIFIYSNRNVTIYHSLLNVRKKNTFFTIILNVNIFLKHNTVLLLLSVIIFI